jgi:hypothetical protein
MRYLKGTIDLGIVYGPDIYGLKPYGYTDSNYAGDHIDRKSIIGYIFFLGGGAVAWNSKKQRTVSTSTTEAEYIASGHGARQAVWIRRFINELDLDEPLGPLLIFGDNESGLKLVRNAEFHDRTKHIDVQHHYVRELVADGYVTVDWVPTKDMLADGFTKALKKDTFVEHRERLGMRRIAG